MEKRISESRYLTLDNGRGLQGTFSSLGAGVYSLTFDGKPLILTPIDKSVYLNSDQLFGKTLGRVAGRIPDTLNINYHTYQLEENEPGVCLHGGLYDSLSFKEFEPIIVTRSDKTYVMFKYNSSHLEAGFPGNVKITVTYTFLHDEDSLKIEYDAQSDEDTILSLSNHMYFNFFGSENLNDYSLMVNASKYGALKKDSKMIDHFKSVPEYLDFRDASLIKNKLNKSDKSLDNTFLFDKLGTNGPQIILEDEKIRLECFTDYEAANIYLDNSLTDVKFTAADNLKMRRAIAIEPQHSPLQPFVLKPGMTYHSTIIYRFTKK